MRTTISDLAGLNQTEVAAMPIMGSEADVQATWARLEAHPGSRASLAGMRCSQGGHTALAGAEMLLMEGFNRPIEVDRGGYDPANPGEPGHTPNVTVSAGATWSEVHHALKGHGLACLVHQSSPHFTVGGGLSVNCHGRDPRQGPLSSTVNWIDVATREGVTRTSPTQDPVLFKAVLGGYGSCGPILHANLRLGANIMLGQTGYKASPEKYAAHLAKLANPPDDYYRKIHLHYGWLQCLAPDRLFDEILSVDYLDQGMPTAAIDGDLKVEDWGDTELLRAAWAAARLGDPKLRKSVWETLGRALESGTSSRLNWMRASISFTSHRGPAETDILQEYFVPVARFDDLRLRLKAIFANARVNVLSATVRVVQRDTLPVNLSYCAGGPMVCIAVDASVPVAGTPRAPTDEVKVWVNQAVDAAVGLGGTFYLPYFRFVDHARFREIYSTWTLQRDTIQLRNEGRRWSNAFVEDYFRD